MNFIYPVLIVLLVSIIPDRLSHFDPAINGYYTLIFIIATILFLFKQNKNSANWLRFDVVFLLGFAIVHIQIPGLASLGIEPHNPEFVWFRKDIVNFATWLSVVSIIFWMWGYSSYRAKSKQPLIQVKSRAAITNFKLIDFCILLCFVSFLLIVGPSLYFGIYDGNESWDSGAAYLFLILSVLINLRVIYFFSRFEKNARIKYILLQFINNKVFVLVVIAYLFMFIFIGDRGPILKLLLFISGAYALYVKDISIKTLVVYVLIGAFVFTLLGMGRSKDVDIASTENIISRGYESYAQSDKVLITSELASSNRILYIALDKVPNAHNYLYGITYPLYLVSIPPFLGGLFVSVFNVDIKYQGTANFFTVINLGPNSTWGVGSEILADIYVNFGIYGVFIIMFLFGKFCSLSLNKALSLRLVSVIVYLCLLSEAVSMNRGMFLQFLKPAVLMITFNYIFLFFNFSYSKNIIKKLYNKKSSP